MSAEEGILDRAAILEVLKDFVPEIRGQMQFMDFLVRAVMSDLERHQEETDAGTRIFLEQLIRMHMNHLKLNGGENGAIGEFMEAVNQWLNNGTPPRAEAQQQNESMNVQDLINATVDAMNLSGGRI